MLDYLSLEKEKRCRATAIHTRRLAGRRLAVVAMVVLSGAVGVACNYGKYGLEPGDDSQATVDGLFRGEYAETKGWRVDQWRQEAMMAAEQATDVAGKLSLAWALHRAGETAKAVAIYDDLLKQNPADYETLCSYATVLQEKRQFAQASQVLQRAVSLKPGFRNGAEELHLKMIDFEGKARADYNYARANLFVPELTSIWKNRKGVEENFSTVDFPSGLSSKSVAELLRQFPDYGEAWLVLGMLLEHEKDFSTAAKAYDRALEKGTAHAVDLKKYMATFREFGRQHDAGRVVGRGIVRLVIGVAALLVGLFLYKTVARVIWDVTSHRTARQEQERRDRRKRDKGPL